MRGGGALCLELRMSACIPTRMGHTRPAHRCGMRCMAWWCDLRYVQQVECPLARAVLKDSEPARARCALTLHTPPHLTRTQEASGAEVRGLRVHAEGCGWAWRTLLGSIRNDSLLVYAV